MKRAFGRSCGEAVWQTEDGQRPLTVISYDGQQFQWAKRDLLEGSFRDAAEGRGLLFAYHEGSPAIAGDCVSIVCGERSFEIPVAGILGDVPFSYGADRNAGSGGELAICSEGLFRELFGEEGYAVLDVQFTPGVTDAQVLELRRRIESGCGEGIAFSDKRISNREVKGAGYSLAVFLYGFLAVIALIAFFNIMNCIAMSVSARMREYGAMRAVGMTARQLVRMVRGEAVTYTISGVLLGCLAGLPLNRLLFSALVTERWGDAWELPGRELLIILAVMACAVCLAVRGPAKQIRRMSVVETIGTQ